MVFRVIILLILLQADFLFGQTSLEQIDLANGKFKVGFLHYTISDSTRTYSRIYDYSNAKITRPIPISLWYPSNQNDDEVIPLKVLDYLRILKEEEEWEHLPDEHILNWFYYANSPANQKHLKEETTAYPKLEFAQGQFPAVVYSPSLMASSIENFAVCEYLASHGYIVISSPSRGTENRWFTNNGAMEMETQARDVEFLIKQVGKFPNADSDKTAVMGFSLGGPANILAQTRNKNIRAVASLDGTERYNYALLKKSPFFAAHKVGVPYIHMAQKIIPNEVLKEDNIDPELNTKFELYDSITKSRAYRLRFHNLTHSYFSTLGVLFQDRDKRQDKSDAEIMVSYKWVSVYVLNFLNAFLKDDDTALAFIENQPSDNGIKEGLISYTSKQPTRDEFSFQDFNDLASKQHYKNLMELYLSVKKKNPSFQLPESNLNTLGLQLVINPETTEQGIPVLLLATELYPNSANLFDSLAEAYLFLGNTEKAIENFEKSLELNAQNQNAIQRLKQLKG
ncbi:alpha/beta hydrolase [Flagellimonas flava]|uniref:Dienelactone hydrolase n=1 Tax=Flagellimonas flava TaxID=570519 RepID=A0A1M5KTB8_9FLAO|nr:alpha/beta hydrolase [Allomuricauda flava]SHG56044.1 Dienelactone hydrolase [Allomuricauda flava]